MGHNADDFDGSDALFNRTKERDSLAAKLAVATEALRWYADIQNYDEESAPCTMGRGGPDEYGPVTEYDLGDKARAALQKIEGGE